MSLEVLAEGVVQDDVGSAKAERDDCQLDRREPIIDYVDPPHAVIFLYILDVSTGRKEHAEACEEEDGQVKANFDTLDSLHGRLEMHLVGGESRL